MWAFSVSKWGQGAASGTQCYWIDSWKSSCASACACNESVHIRKSEGIMCHFVKVFGGNQSRQFLISL